MLASLGCGNPTALAQLNSGEVILDLGSGGRIDALTVGPASRRYRRGLWLAYDHEMLALARENQRKSGLKNVESLKGEIKHVPLPDASVNVVITASSIFPPTRIGC